MLIAIRLLNLWNFISFDSPFCLHFSVEINKCCNFEWKHSLPMIRWIWFKRPRLSNHHHVHVNDFDSSKMSRIKLQFFSLFNFASIKFKHFTNRLETNEICFGKKDFFFVFQQPKFHCNYIYNYETKNKSAS